MQRAIVALAVLVAATFIVTLASLLGRLAVGDTLQQAVHATASLHFRLLRVESGNDSWGAMYAAQTRLAARAQQPGSGGSLYTETLQIDRCKFQYPPSALLLLDLLPAPPIDSYQCETDAPERLRTIYGEHWPAKLWIDVAGRAAALATIGVAAWVLLTLLASAPGGVPPPTTRTQTVGLVVLFLVAGLMFFPLIRSYWLGQIQVFLNLFVAVAVLAMLKGRPALAGVLVGLCVIFKPQLLLLLVWAVLRREGAFAKGLLSVVVLGYGLALWKFGLDLHLEYVRTLSVLSRLGEVYWPNQSVNGILHRFLENGDPRRWNYTEFAPYQPFVRWATVGSSLCILAAALWFGRRRPDRTARALDFSAMAAAATLASPIAWEHHYGVFLAFIALAAGAVLCAPRARPGLLLAVGASYLLMANALLPPDALFANRWLGLLASNLFAGAMTLFVVLLLLLKGEPAPRARTGLVPRAVRADG